jgi:hypothetical protein
MPIEITSTTDTPEAVIAAKAGDLARGKPVVETPTAVETKVPTEKPAESVTADAKVTEDERDDDDDGPVQPDGTPGPKKKGGFKKRIDKLTGKLTAKEQEVEYWKSEAMKQQKTAVQPTEKVVENKPDQSDKPIADNFDTHEKYVDALTDWKLDQREKVKIAKDRETQTKTEFQKKSADHVKRQQEFVKEHTDFDELMEAVEDIPMTLVVQQVILDSENGPELMYELAKNREEYERICKLPAIAAARELGKFESRIAKASETVTPETKVSKASAPLKPVTGKAQVPQKGYYEGMSQAEFKKWRASGGGT